MHLLTTLLVVAALPALARGSGSYWVSAEDRQAALDAKIAREVFCGEEDTRGDIDKEAGRKTLESGAGGTNVILEILEESTSSDEFSTKAEEKITPAWLAMKAGPLIFAIILFVFWFACCWSACPCCRCCRCGEKNRKTLFVAKLIILVIGGGLCLGIAIAALLALGGYSKAVDGFDNLACTAAELVNSTLGGQPDPYFVGLMPLLSTFKTLDDQLEMTSPMMTQVTTLIDSTSEITDAVNIAAETITALEDALSNMPAGLASNHHSCEFCTQLAPILGETADAIQGGVGAALSSARVEIDKQLSPAKAAELQESLRAGGAPLGQLKDLVREALTPLTDIETFDSIKGILTGPLLIATSLIIVLAFLLMGCMCTSLLNFTFLEKCGKSDNVDQDGKQVKPYNKGVHRCSGCTWCCGFFYAMLAFFIGGLLNAINVPLSSVCLIMDDLSADMLINIGPGLGLNLTGDGGTMIKDMIDQCFVPAEGVNAKLLDIMFTTNSTGYKTSMTEMIVDSTKAQITAQFDQVTAMMASSPSLANSSEIQSLISMLADPISMMILPVDTYGWDTDTDYQAMFTADDLKDLFMSSVRCENGTVSGVVPAPLGNRSIPGVKEFQDRLAAYGTQDPSRLGCTKTLSVCSDAAGYPRAVCDAGINYINLKHNIRSLTDYKCDVFEDALGGDCDPKDMTVSGPQGSRVWSGGCVKADGTMTRKSKTCNLADFVTYVQEFGDRIEKVMRRIDDTVEKKGSDIDQGLRDVVQEHIIGPIEGIANGVTCGFIGEAYDNFVGGMCYQAVAGFIDIANSYLACGILTLFMQILMYGVWRRSIDNVNRQKDVVVVNIDSQGVVPGGK